MKQQRQQHKNLLWQFIQLNIPLPRDVKGEIFVNIPMVSLGLKLLQISSPSNDTILFAAHHRQSMVNICSVITNDVSEFMYNEMCTETKIKTKI